MENSLAVPMESCSLCPMEFPSLTRRKFRSFRSVFLLWRDVRAYIRVGHVMAITFSNSSGSSPLIPFTMYSIFLCSFSLQLFLFQRLCPYAVHVSLPVFLNSSCISFVTRELLRLLKVAPTCLISFIVLVFP